MMSVCCPVAHCALHYLRHKTTLSNHTHVKTAQNMRCCIRSSPVRGSLVNARLWQVFWLIPRLVAFPPRNHRMNQRQWLDDKTSTGITAAGLYRTCTCFPLSSCAWQENRSRYVNCSAEYAHTRIFRKSDCKVKHFFAIKQINRSNFAKLKFLRWKIVVWIAHFTSKMDRTCSDNGSIERNVFAKKSNGRDIKTSDFGKYFPKNTAKIWKSQIFLLYL
jgi:hypothetical protein